MSNFIPELVRPRRRQRPGGPRRWTEADKAAYLARFAESRLSGAAFCRMMDLPRATFTLWQREARVAAARPGSGRRSRYAQFARVALVPGSKAPATRPRAGEVAAIPTMTLPMTVSVRGVTGSAAELTGVDAVTAVEVVRLVLSRLR